jgi:glycerol-3-phosphate dehydrogenase
LHQGANFRRCRYLKQYKREIFMSDDYQAVVIGSGSAGREACLSAAKAGLRTLLVEERDLGGTSLHAGSYAVWNP